MHAQVVDAEIERLEQARQKAGITHVMGPDHEQHPSQSAERKWQPSAEGRGSDQLTHRPPDGRVLNKPKV